MVLLYWAPTICWTGKVRFTWTAIPGEHPRWEQAFSNDAGQTWETNWKMEFFRVGADDLHIVTLR